MNWVNITIAFLPENFLLAGIVVLIGLEVCGARERSALPVSLLALILATAAAAWLSLNGYAYAAFPGHYSVDAAALLAKALVLALTVPVLLISRDEIAQRQFHILMLSSPTSRKSTASSISPLRLGSPGSAR